MKSEIGNTIAIAHVGTCPSCQKEIMYSPRLQCLYQSLSNDAQTCITNIGITSVLETNAWDTAAEFAPDHLQDALQTELRQFWRAAQGACAVAVKQAVREFSVPSKKLDECRMEPKIQTLSGRASVPVCNAVLQVKRRKLQPMPADEAQQHLQGLQLREKRVVEDAASALWSLFLDIGACGRLWSEYVVLTPSDQQQFANMFFDEMCLVAPTTLQAALRLMRRWRRHCEECEVEPWKSSSIHVAIWLRSLRERGPTAPHGAFSTLKWLEKKLGVDFHTSCDRVRGQSAVPQNHVESQATPLTLKMILGLESLLTSRNHAVSGLALAWILLTFAVLRFAHLQRSVISRVLDNGIAATASLGKRRTQGRRRPFEWRAPRWGVTGCDIGAAVHEQLARSFGVSPQPGFFLPDILPSRCTLQNATGFSARPMSLGRFSRLSQHLFQQPPFSLTGMEAAAVTSYSARRVFPTIAELARLDPHELLLVGDWKGARKGGQDISMPLRYADQKLHTSLSVKTELVCIIQHVSAQNPAHSDWAELSGFFPPRLVSRQQAAHVLQNGRAAIYLPEPVAAVRGNDHSSSSSDSSTSDTDSDSSSVDTVANEAADSSEVQWLLSKGPKGHLHICKPLQLQTKRWHTQCNRGLKDPDIGVGLEDAFSTGRQWSPRCFSSLPKQLQNIWQDMRHSDY
eukprot:s1255_g39.t1